jgi:filamentous hemagglutinin family protein
MKCINNIRRNPAIRCVVTAAMIFALAANAPANPTGLTVGSGTATVNQSGSQLTITASQNAFLNWNTFNIAAGETTIFKQPSASSVVWNRVNDPNPSQIFGNLQANGVVVLLNSSGFYFGPHSFVSAAGLVVSTANFAPPENSGGTWEFNGPPPLASIINYGHIQVGTGGQAFLIADQIENHGTIEAPGGTIGLASGQTVLLSERPDGRGMSMAVTLPGGSVDNFGNLVADAGTIALNAKVVNQDGIIQANSVQNQNGIIELVAADSLTLGAGSQILARGDDSTPGSSGGSATLQSGNNFGDNAGSQISVTGGGQGGNGGNIEISAPNILSLDSSLDASAKAGSTDGQLLLNSRDITLNASGANGMNGSTLDLNVNGTFANFSQIILQASGDTTTGSGNITFAAGTSLVAATSWDLGAGSGQLTLQAGGDITFGNGSKIFDASNWSVALAAGYSFVNTAVQYHIGNIYLNGGSGQTVGGSIQMAFGESGSPAISLTAGQNILVGTGYVITTAGGGIYAQALAGNIDAGSDAQGYHFMSSASSLDNAYTSSGGLGGISTEAGGDVSLIAGGNVSTVLPGNKGYYYNGNLKTAANADFSTAGSGSYGHLAGQSGNVTVVAGGNVTGNYTVADGTGSIFAGVKMDADGNPVKDASGNYVLGTTGSAGTSQTTPNLALSLIRGGWNVDAAQNIILQEVRNPNGIFDVNGGTAYKHLFDYGLDDYVNLTAGNLVQLGASSSLIPRPDSTAGFTVPIVYPSILNITAGFGGVLLNEDPSLNQLILFPSPDGSLNIDTTSGGPLFATTISTINGSIVYSPLLVKGVPQIFNLIVSDSGKSQYKASGDFGLNDHAASPVHLDDPTPITLDISGDMDLVLLGAPEAAQISVGGNMDNSRFQGMNLSAADVTSITVAGDINNRGNFTTIVLDLSVASGELPPDLSYFSQAVNNFIGPTSLPEAKLAATLFYNPKTQTLTYQNIPNQTLANVLNLLQNLTVQVYNNGVPQWSDPPYNTKPETTTVSVLNPATAKALLNEYNADNITSGLEQPSDINNPNPALSPDGTYGYFIGGGGKFGVSARNMDLGTTAGIQSLGVSLYTIGGSYPLAQKAQFTSGADIQVQTTGDLNMYSTSIESLNGGTIQVNVGVKFDDAGNVIFENPAAQLNAGSADFTVNSTGARGIFSTSHGDVTVDAGGDININGSRIATYDGGNISVESLAGNVDCGNGGNGSVVVYNYSTDPDTFAVSTSVVTIHGSGILATTFPDSFSSVGDILVTSPNGNIIAKQAGISQYNLNTIENPNATVTLLAGYELDKITGLPVFKSSDRDIDVSGFGVIAQNASLKATGSINGLIFAKGNSDVVAQQNVNVTVLAEGTANVSAGGTVSGTIIGVGGVSASGSSIDASLLSNNSISGQTSGQSGMTQGTAANATSAAASNENASQTATTTSDANDNEPKGDKQPITLAQRVGRVTVLLPGKKE